MPLIVIPAGPSSIDDGPYFSAIPPALREIEARPPKYFKSIPDALKSKVVNATSALIEIPLGVTAREDNSPVPPGARGILPQSRFTLPIAELKLISPKRASVSLAAAAGGKERLQ